MTPASEALHGPHYARGLAAVLAGGLALSFTGLFFRLIEDASGWQIMFYRTFSMAVGVLLVVAYRSRGQLVPAFRAIGRPGLVAAAVMGLGFPLYTLALAHTTVADALFLISTAPLFAALIGWIFLRERVRAATWIASLVALVGVGLMFGDGFAGGSFLGKAMAIGAAAALAGYTVCVRASPLVDMAPALVLAGLIGSGIAAAADNLGVSLHDLLLCLFMGGVQATFGFVMITYGPKYVPAAEVMLLALAEVVLGPVWVLLIVGEIPSYYTIAGGVVVLVAVVLFTLASLRRARRRREEEAPTPTPQQSRPVALPPLEADRPPVASAPLAMEAVLEIAYQKATKADRSMPTPEPPPPVAVDTGGEAPIPRQPVPDARVRVAPPPSPDLLPIGRRVNTVESRLADRLRPLLQEWVDRELPRIAESVLRAEVRRMIQHAEETAEDRM